MPFGKGFLREVPIFWPMSLGAYLWGIRLFLLLSLCAWVGIIVAVDPYQSGNVGLGLFYASLFGTVLGMMTLFTTWVYRRALGIASAAHHLGGAFRQAFLLSLLIVAGIFLQMEQWLTWWDALLLLSVILLIEFTARRFGSPQA